VVDVPTTRSRFLPLAGVGVFAALALAVALVFMSFNGDFGDNVVVTASIGRIGDSLDTGDIVTYRDVIVGEVRSFKPDGHGGADLRLRIQANFARNIPTGVTALAVPATLFGNTEILLLPPATIGGQVLHNGQRVLADASPGAVGLQTALADAYDLITSVHPAQLDAALTALADAFQNQGSSIGRLVDEAAAYLRALAPSIPQLDAVISRFASVSAELARSSPSLVQSVANLLTPARAVVDERQAIAQLLNIAPGATDDATRLIEANGDNIVTIVTNERPFLTALSADPNALTNSINGFRSFAAALNSTFHNGHASLNVVISGINTSGLVPLLLGQTSEVVQKLVDPPTYGPADCPRYPGAAGPNCLAAASTQSGAAVQLTTGQSIGGSASSIGEPHEVAAMRAVVSAITGAAPNEIPAAMDVIVGPLLRNTTTVIR
jgi:phospholipid/cholesterol/gamma-HCH transport system substrate-binding protein